MSSSSSPALLTPDSLAPLAVSLLPTEDNSLTSPVEALALLIHAVHSSLGFRLIAPVAASTQEQQPTSSNLLGGSWKNGGSPRFKYRHEQSSLEFVISIQELGGRGAITAVAVEDNKAHSFSILLTDYLSASSFPSTPTESNNFLTLFSTAARLSDFVSLYRINIIQPLIPGLRKDGYSEISSSTSSSSASGSGARAPLGNPRGPYFPDPGGPMIPGGGGMGIPPFRGGGERGGQGIGPFPPSGGSPFNIGRSDLDPLGGQGGMFAGFPGAGRIGIPGGFGDEGGMMVGPNHPLFRERFGQGNGGGVGGGGRLWGGDGWLPQGAVPPGARFDPVGPANGPVRGGGVGIGGFGGGQGVGQFPGAQGGTGAGGGPLRGTGTNDPDWDDVRPPSGDNEEWRDSMFG